MRRLLFVACLLGATPARADNVVLRIATAVPDGTLWAREIRTMGRDIERRTEGRVRVKMYWGSIAGGDLEVGERIRRGQLDGALSGGPLCSEVMPSARVLGFPGLFQSADETKHVMNQLAAQSATEAEQAGFTFLGSSPIGASTYFGRKPITSFAELRNTPIWVWDDAKVTVRLLKEMGLKVVPTPVERAAREFEAGHLDSFWAIPTAALAFQWSAQAQQLLVIRGDYVNGCALVASRVFATLSPEDQNSLRSATAQFRERLDEESRREEQALLGGAFQHQGVKVSHPNEKFRSEYYTAANAARDRIGATLVPAELLNRVRGLLSDFRAEHGSRP
jgi:TRAP-type C4-dicarboxylate transport system substrate-binding protein